MARAGVYSIARILIQSRRTIATRGDLRVTRAAVERTAGRLAASTASVPISKRRADADRQHAFHRRRASPLALRFGREAQVNGLQRPAGGDFREQQASSGL